LVTYWRQISNDLKASATNPVWRAFCDSLNVNWLAANLPTGSLGAVLKTDLFDEAVGQGVYPLLKSAAEHVHGIDLATSICLLAASRYADISAVASDVRRIPFRRGAFDVVVSLSTLDHFESVLDIETGLRELFFALKPGGCLLMTLDNLSNPIVRVRNATPWWLLKKSGLTPYPVGVSLGQTDFCGLLKRTGFEISDFRTLMHVPRLPAVLLARLLYKLGKDRFTRKFCQCAASLERLGHFPFAPWTGYYTAVKAHKPADQ
jgi:SAM-dependent methyltransferase